MRREFHVRFCESPGVRFPRATRLVICFERADDAHRVWNVLGERFKKYGLALHPKKTRSFSFQAPRDGDGSGGATFDFLGFTLHWQRARRPGTGGWHSGLGVRVFGGRLPPRPSGADVIGMTR
jgi:hypothetical protein